MTAWVLAALSCCVAADVEAVGPPRPQGAALAGEAQQACWGRATAEDPAIRTALAAELGATDDGRGQLLLWLLAHDPDEAVRQVAVQSALKRCERDTAAGCAVLLQPFLRGKEAPSSTLARSYLLARLPEAALLHAPPGYKLQLVAGATAQLGEPPGRRAAERLLRRLGEDPELEVQQAAAAALMLGER